MPPGHRTFPIRQGLCDVDVVSVAWALGSGDQKCPSDFFCSQITDSSLSGERTDALGQEGNKQEWMFLFKHLVCA